jgi:hypothetical protein
MNSPRAGHNLTLCFQPTCLCAGGLAETISSTPTFNKFSLGQATVCPRLSGFRSTAHIGTSLCESVRNDTEELSTACQCQVDAPKRSPQVQNNLGAERLPAVVNFAAGVICVRAYAA